MNAALWLAIAGIVLSAVSLTWQAATFRLTGSIVRAELKHGGVGMGGVLFGSPGTYSQSLLASQGFTQEVIGVEVFNRGRLPVSITGWALQIEGKETFSMTTQQVGPPLPYRLEAGANERWFMPMAMLRPAVATSVETFHRRSPSSIRGLVALGTGGTVKTKQSMKV